MLLSLSFTITRMRMATKATATSTTTIIPITGPLTPDPEIQIIMIQYDNMHIEMCHLLVLVLVLVDSKDWSHLQWLLILVQSRQCQGPGYQWLLCWSSCLGQSGIWCQVLVSFSHHLSGGSKLQCSGI